MKRPSWPSRGELGGAPPQGQSSERPSLPGQSLEARRRSAGRPAGGGTPTVSRRETEKSGRGREDQSSPRSRRTKGPARGGRGGRGGGGERGKGGGKQGLKTTKGSRGASRRGIDGGSPTAETTPIPPMMMPRKMYPSAGAFMVRHFPRSDAQVRRDNQDTSCRVSMASSLSSSSSSRCSLLDQGRLDSRYTVLFMVPCVEGLAIPRHQSSRAKLVEGNSNEWSFSLIFTL